MADVNYIKNHVLYQWIFARFILLDYNGLGVKAIRAVMSYKLKIKMVLDEAHKIFKYRYIKTSVKKTFLFYEYLIKEHQSICLKSVFVSSLLFSIILSH